MRRLAPDADPILLPLAALLNGLGYVFIARLDEELAAAAGQLDRGRHRRLRRHALRRARRPRTSSATATRSPSSASACCCCRCCPASARRSTAPASGSSVGPVSFQPGEFAKIVLAIFFAAYLVEKRELLATSVWQVGPLRLPDPKYLGPVLLAWGVIAGRDGRPEGPRLLAAVLRPVRGDALGRHRAHVVPRDRRWPVRRRAPGSRGGRSATCRTASTIWLDPWKDPSGDGYQIVQGLFAMAFGGITGTGLGLGGDVRIPASETDFIFAVIAEELGLLGGALVICAFLLMVGSGLRIAVAGRPRLRQAAGHRPHHAARPPGVHHHRRRHPTAAAHRCHAAVRVLRRLVARRQLRAARPAAADRATRTSGAASRPRPTAAAGGVNRRSAASASASSCCYLALFVMLNWIQVVAGGRPRRQPAQHRPGATRLQPAAGHDRLRRRRGAGPERRQPRHRVRVRPGAHLSRRATSSASPPASSRSATAPPASSSSTTTSSSGTTFEQQVRGFGDLFVARENVGNVTVSLRKDVQQVARDAARRPRGLGRRPRPPHRRAARLLELPVATTRTCLSTTDQAAAETGLGAATTWHPASPLRAHQYQERYFPGSTFKVVTGSVGLADRQGHHRASPSTRGARATLPPQTDVAISNFGGQLCGGTLFEILRVSCNTAFAEMGAETIGPDDMVDGAESLGFNAARRPSTCPTPAKSVFPTDFTNNLPEAGPGRRSARTTCRPPRCRWRWWPPASPTAARS